MAQLDVVNLSVALGEPPQRVLDHISLQCTAGTVTLLIGPNGCGKSVLLRGILGLVPTEAGTVGWNTAVLRRSFRSLHRAAGVVFQNPDQQLFGTTVREDLLLGHREGTEIRDDVLDLLMIRDLLDSPPGELSGGQRRRVAIAGAFTGSPEIIMLDEPFLELDYPAIQGLLTLVERFRSAGGIVITASHETRDIWPLVDQVLLLRRGVPVFRGSREGAAPLITRENGLRPLQDDGVRPSRGEL